VLLKLNELSGKKKLYEPSKHDNDLAGNRVGRRTTQDDISKKRELTDDNTTYQDKATELSGLSS